MEFRVLGSLEVQDGDRPVDLGAPRERALLALLLLHANQVVPRDRIVHELWPDGPPRTANKVVQVYVTHLRRALGSFRDVLESRDSGYVILVEPGELDLRRFERLVERAMDEPARLKARTLREALALWRGPALGEFAYDAFVQAEAARLEELRLLALEERIAADLEQGSGPELVPELESLVTEHPLRERLRGQLMLSLYRAGRQADALAVFRDGRKRLDDELGLEPSEPLRELERAILRQDRSLAPGAGLGPQRSIVVVAERTDSLRSIVAIAEHLARGEMPRELVLAKIVPASEVTTATAELDALNEDLADGDVTARVAAFTSSAPARDVARLAGHQDTDLLLFASAGDPFSSSFADVFAQATCDVAALIERGGALRDGPVIVPFGAFEHDWAALELGTWLARALDRPLQLMGAADTRPGGADASRLLADASLVVQHTTGLVAQPLLGAPGHDGLRSVASGAGLLVVGLSERWRAEGLGDMRRALVADPRAPLVLVRRGLRPGGIAPSATLTRFTWSIERSRIGG